MTAAERAAGRAGLREELLAADWPEFRIEVLVPDPGDPVLGVKLCAAAGCDRPVHQQGMCTGHSLPWRKQGHPNRAGFLADPGPLLRGRTELGSCTVPGYATAPAGRGCAPGTATSGPAPAARTSPPG